MFDPDLAHDMAMEAATDWDAVTALGGWATKADIAAYRAAQVEASEPEDDGPREGYECYGCMFATVDYARLEAHYSERPTHSRYRVRAAND